MKILRILLSLVLLAFGALSTILTVSVVFDLFGIREREGNYVLFIVWTNLVCGLIYLVAAYTNWKKLSKTTTLLSLAVTLLVISFIVLEVYISNGGIYEVKTENAMLFRIGITTVMLVVSNRLNKKNPINKK
jgi:hypothetical protein